MNGPQRDRRRTSKGPRKRPPSGGPSRNPLPPGRTLGFWIVVVLMLLFAMQLLMNPTSQERPITYTTFESQLEAGNLAEVTVIDGEHPALDELGEAVDEVRQQELDGGYDRIFIKRSK